MSEEKDFRRRLPAKLVKVREITANTQNPVRIIGIVVQAKPGIALVQDVMDEPNKHKSIQVQVEGTLNVDEKYLLIGDVVERSSADGKELMLAVSIAHNVNTLDVKLYKEALDLQAEVESKLNG
ncbi:MAG: hypothetical protein BAJATHORv1_20508 [Candidatus Thorarchaeota archaeon]|nr:MAG: hypothetical protein BAJATHORv1_20508 [Candidatus Thorarchaeota archaeon]